MSSVRVPRQKVSKSEEAAAAAALLGATLFALPRVKSKATASKATVSGATASGTAEATAQPATSGPPQQPGGQRQASSLVIPFPRSQAAQAVVDILRPLATPDEVIQVLAGAGERGWIQPFSNRLVGRVPAGQKVTVGLPVPDGFVIFAVGELFVDAVPHTPNAYVSGFSEDNSPPSIAPIFLTGPVRFPAAFLLPASINVSFTITGDPDIDLIYTAHANAIGTPLDYAEFIRNYLRTQVRAVDLLEAAAVSTSSPTPGGQVVMP